jgi:hypothetical protein
MLLTTDGDGITLPNPSSRQPAIDFDKHLIGDNLRVIPIVTYGAASNLDDLLYLRSGRRARSGP